MAPDGGGSQMPGKPDPDPAPNATPDRAAIVAAGPPMIDNDCHLDCLPVTPRTTRTTRFRATSFPAALAEAIPTSIT
jgi:hypothetical protein